MRRGRGRLRNLPVEQDWGAQIEELAARLASYGLVPTDEIKRRFHIFCTQLLAWNDRYALISRQDTANIFRKHVAASLGPLLLLAPGLGEEWVDVGSGAGFPGLILKIWAPDQRITLIDGSRKKCLFLDQVSREAGLGSIPLLQVRVETLVARGELIGAFHVLFARAVADLSTTLREFGPLVLRGGQIISFKGPQWQEDVQLADKHGLWGDGRFALEEVLRVPWAPSHLLRIRKLS